jgi:hypothetical protein
MPPVCSFSHIGSCPVDAHAAVIPKDREVSCVAFLSKSREIVPDRPKSTLVCDVIFK